MDNSVIFSIGLEKKMQLDKLAPKFEKVETFRNFSRWPSWLRRETVMSTSK